MQTPFSEDKKLQLTKDIEIFIIFIKKQTIGLF